MVRQRAYGIVRADIVGELADDWARVIRQWAVVHGFELRCVETIVSDAAYPLLIATLRPSGITALAVPSLGHFDAWIAAVRDEVDVWTMLPLRRWPSQSITPPETSIALPSERL